MPASLHTPAEKTFPEERRQKHQLQTFDTFISNAKHRLVLSVLHELAAGHEPAGPVILCGASGTGKSHLLHAVVYALKYNEAREHLNGNARGARQGTFYKQSTSVQKMDEFAEQLLAADKNGTLENFRTTFLQRNILVLDDIHTIQPTRVYEGLTALLDTFTSSGRPVLMAGTGQPADWPLPRQLRSRVRSALLFELPEADLDITLRFLDTQLREATLNLSRDDRLLMSRKCHDLRQVTGIVRRLAVQERLTGKAVGRIDLEALMAQQGELTQLTHTIITTVVAQQFSIPQSDLFSHDRRSDRVRARQIAMYLCRQLLGLSYPSIGAIFHGKDHSTVIHAVKKINKLQQDNNDMNKLVTELTKQCQIYGQQRK